MRFIGTWLLACLAAFLSRLGLELFLFGHSLDARGLLEELLAALVAALVVTVVVLARKHTPR